MRKKYIFLFIIFLLAAILITFPLVLNMTSKLYGEKGDVYGVVWSMWVHTFISKFEYPLNLFVSTSGAPFGFVRDSIQPVLDFIIFFLSDIFGEIFAYNLLIILGFVLTAASTYLLVYYITRHHLASIFAGFIFGFSPYMIAHAIAGHIGLSVMNFFIPVYVWALIKAAKEKNIKNSVICGVLFIFLAFSCIYNGYIILFFTCYLFCFELFRLFREKEFKFDIILRWGLMMFIALGVVALFEKYVLYESSGSILIHRPFKELFIYSAKPWNYMLPSVYNPFFGDTVRSFSDRLLMGSNYTEQTLYLGLIPLILACYIIFKAIKRRGLNTDKAISDRKSFVVFFATSALVMMIFSAPPFLPLGSFKIEHGEIITKYKLYFPSYFLYKIAPMFRVYARFGVLVLLCVSVLSAVGFASIYENIKTKKKKVIFSVSVFLLLIVEFASIPKFIDIKYTPPVYKWLAEQKEDFTVVEYPLDQDIHGLPAEYQFFQRIHRKKIFNGTVAGSYADKLRLNMLQPFSEYTIGNLKRMGVKYLIIHRDKYIMNKGSVPEVNKNLRIKFTGNFDATDVYLISM